MPKSNNSALRIILLTGFVAGSLDILAACTQFYINTGKNPVIVLKYVASGVFGKTEAYADGAGMALWGLLFHFMIAFGLTVFFFWLYPKWRLLGKNRFLTGVGYGIFAWLITNLVIVPLSAIPKQTIHPDKALIAAAILVCMIGMPISYMISGYYRKKGS